MYLLIEIDNRLYSSKKERKEKKEQRENLTLFKSLSLTPVWLWGYSQQNLNHGKLEDKPHRSSNKYSIRMRTRKKNLRITED
jgi:hypothetical protein